MIQTKVIAQTLGVGTDFSEAQFLRSEIKNGGNVISVKINIINNSFSENLNKKIPLKCKCACDNSCSNYFVLPHILHYHINWYKRTYLVKQ